MVTVGGYIEESKYRELPDPNQGLLLDRMGALIVTKTLHDPGLNCAVGALDCLLCLETVAAG